MSTETDSRTSSTGQAVEAEDLAKVREAAPSQALGQRVLEVKDANVPEEVLRTILMEAAQGKRILPRDPKAAEVAKRVWAALDVKPPLFALYVPGDLA